MSELQLSACACTSYFNFTLSDPRAQTRHSHRKAACCVDGSMRTTSWRGKSHGNPHSGQTQSGRTRARLAGTRALSKTASTWTRTGVTPNSCTSACAASLVTRSRSRQRGTRRNAVVPQKHTHGCRQPPRYHKNIAASEAGTCGDRRCRNRRTRDKFGPQTHHHWRIATRLSGTRRRLTHVPDHGTRGMVDASSAP